MIKAQSEFQSADYQMNQMNAEQQRRAQQPQQQYQPYPEPQPQPQPQPQVQAPPQPTEKAAKWAQDNPWFGQEKT